MKRRLEPWDCARELLQGLPGGLLLTAGAAGRVNPMTIGWGTLGIQWATPIFTVFVRENRFTRQLLDQNPEFTISAPQGEGARKILSLCGTKSGRELDKVAAAGLTLVEPEAISVPAIRELPLTLECRVVYRQPQEPAAIHPRFIRRFYPPEVDSGFCGANRDYHTAYYGEILAAYILE